MKEQNQFNIVLKSLASYESARGENKYLPLHQFLKKYFRENRQMGSSDRRNISRLLYNYFRLGNILKELSKEQRIALGSFICETERFPLLEFILIKHSPLTPGELLMDLYNKLKMVKRHYPDFDVRNIFPFEGHLSEGIDKKVFLQSFFVQPKLWIRIPQNAETQAIVSLLKENNISFQSHPAHPRSLSFDNRTPLDKLQAKGLFEIQDLSSQLTGDYFQPGENEYWWDCCAGSGGKSLMLLGQNPSVKIFATDSRKSVLENLNERFSKAGFNNYSCREMDLISDFKPPVPDLSFDGIIADVPCSGSGTWARTPEMLSRFSLEEIENYHRRQVEIASKVILHLKKGKPLVYITCSVFKRENEDVISYLVHECKMQLEKSALIKGYAHSADTLFVARLIK